MPFPVYIDTSLLTAASPACVHDSVGKFNNLSIDLSQSHTQCRFTQLCQKQGGPVLV